MQTVEPVPPDAPGSMAESGSPNGAVNRLLMRMFHRWRRGAGFLGLGLCLAGSLLHATLRDAVPFPLYVLYYALPRAMLTAIAGLATLLLLQRNPLRLHRGAACLTVGLLLWFLATDFAWRGQFSARQHGQIQVAVWNAAGHPHGWSPETRLPSDWLPTTAEIDRWNADLIGLVECGEDLNSKSVSWEQRFQGYEVDHLGTGLVLLVRGRILNRGDLSLGDGGQAVWYDVEIDGQQFRCVLVDIASSLMIPRNKAVARLSKTVSASADRPVLIFGDFNLPPESRWLDQLRNQGFQEAFEIAGTGYAPTWPAPLPVLTLDQIWGNQRIRFSQCERGWTWHSDHRPVFARVEIESP